MWTTKQLDGAVYDVSEGRRTYGPGGSYHFMYASEASRVYFIY